MKKYIVFLLLLGAFASCRRKYTSVNEQASSQDTMKEHLENAYKIRVHQESEEIDDFVKRHGFTVVQTGTGLRIGVYQKAAVGSTPKIHDKVKVIASVFLLDGTLCYPADTTNPYVFKIGEGMSNSGLEEGLMMMKEGEKAHIIVPSHLGFGLSGDGDKIPPGAAICYDVHLLKVN